MATPSPSPGPIEADLVQAPTTPSAATPSPALPMCGACGGEAVVHWRRRPTDDELAHLVQAEQSRRDEALRLADPQLPRPTFPPLPTADDVTRTVYACGSHAISLDAASRVHASACTAPNDADLPDCDCSPEPLPGAAASPDETEQPVPSRLPSHWLPGVD